MGNNAAINDIINNPRYQGALSSIKGVTQVLDSFFVQFISIIAFFIISSAFLRNVIAGAYASYPIFFDKVNEAKTAAQDKLKGKGPKGIGSVAAFLLSLLPDFKELSEFRDNNIQPRDYFIKAIPQMFAVMMIGVVIYNGYYRDVAAKVAYLGSEMIHRFIVNVDPVEVWDQMTNSVGAPTLSSSSDNSVKGKFVNAVAKDMYSQTVSFYTDIKGVAAKNKLSSAVENWCYTNLGSVDTKYYDSDNWKPTYQLIKVLGQPKLNVVSDNPDERYMKQFAVQVKSLQIDSAVHSGEDWYYEITCTYVRQHSGVKAAGNVDVDMNVPSSAAAALGSGNFQISIKDSTFWSLTTLAQVSANNKTYSVQKNGNTLVITGLKSATALTATGVSYVDPDGTAHSIKTITFGGSGNITFKYSTTSGATASFTEGQSPAAETATGKKTG